MRVVAGHTYGGGVGEPGLGARVIVRLPSAFRVITYSTEGRPGAALGTGTATGVGSGAMTGGAASAGFGRHLPGTKRSVRGTGAGVGAAAMGFGAAGAATGLGRGGVG